MTREEMIDYCGQIVARLSNLGQHEIVVARMEILEPIVDGEGGVVLSGVAHPSGEFSFALTLKHGGAHLHHYEKYEDDPDFDEEEEEEDS